MQQRTQDAISDWRAYQHAGFKDTPVGFRLQYYAFAHVLFNRHPWIGNGTSGFSDAFNKERPIQSRSTLFEPHSQYWLVAVDSGVIGLAFLALFFACLFKAIRHSDLRPIALGMLISFLLGSTADSLLLYAGTGYFFLLFMALCLADVQDSSCAKR